MATTDTNLPQIIFNKLSQAKYDELKASGQLKEDEFYITPDIDSDNLVTINTKQTITAEKTFEDGIRTNTIVPVATGSESKTKISISDNTPSIDLMVAGDPSTSTTPDNGLQIVTTAEGTVSAKLIGDKINSIPKDSNDGTLVTTAYLNSELSNFTSTTITYWN